MGSPRKRKNAAAGGGTQSKKRPAKKATPTPTPTLPVPSPPMASPAAEAEDDAEVSFKKPSPSPSPSPPPKKGTPDGPPPPRRSPNGFLLPDPLQKGFLLKDNRKGMWTVGKVLGTGGFGEIYEARFLSGKDENGDQVDETGKEYVVKVEPHSNGPLFVEMAFFLRAAKADLIQDFKESRQMEHLGVPSFRASGSYRLHGKKFRFLIMPRYGVDLQSIMDTAKPGSRFSNKTAASMALQVLDSLEYIHSRGYIHKDIKGSNLLLGRRGDQRHKLFLVDFGLCSRYIQDGMHRPYAPDRRWAHEGTLEYTSRDCHLGCFSRRGDMEVLFYNMVEWLGGRLPWEDLAESEPPPKIHQVKIEAFRNPDRFLSECFEGRQAAPPGFLRKMMVSVEKLRFEEEPDYQYLRCLFSSEVYNSAARMDEVSLNIEMVAPKEEEKENGANVSGNSSGSESDKENEMPSSQNGFEAPPPLPQRETDKLKASANFVNGDSESLSQSNSRGHISESSYERARQVAILAHNERSLANPTKAMKEQMERMANRRSREGTPVNARTRRAHTNRFKKVVPSPLTPAMREVMEQQSKRKRGSPKKRKLNDSAEDDEVTFVSPSRKKLKFDGLSPDKKSRLGSSPKKTRRTSAGDGPAAAAAAGSSSPRRPLVKRAGMTRSHTLPHLRQESPSLSRQVSQAVGAGFGFIMGVSRKLMTSFSRNIEA